MTRLEINEQTIDSMDAGEDSRQEQDAKNDRLIVKIEKEALSRTLGYGVVVGD